MKKRHLQASLLTIISLLLLTSCDNNSKRDYVILYIWGDNSEISSYESIASSYRELTGTEVRVIPATDSYYNSLNIQLGSSKSAPDIFFTEGGEFPSHIASNKLLNLTPYIESGALDIKTASNDDGQIELWDINDSYRYDGDSIGQGDYYALIKDWSPDFVLWYNKGLFDRYNEVNNYKAGDEGFLEYPSETIPMSWDEFYDLSNKFVGLDLGGGVKVNYGTMLDRVPYKHLMEWIQMTGSSTWTSDGMEFNYTDPGVKKAFEFFINLQNGEKKSSPIIGPTSIGSGDLFRNGQLPFCFYGNWAYSNYNWDTIGFDFGLCPPPVPAKKSGEALTIEDTYATSCGMVGLAVYRSSPVVDKAVDFLNYYMTVGQEFMAEKSFNIPGNKLVANSDAFMENEDANIAYINEFFMNIATNYTHEIVYNKYVSQEAFENIIGIYLIPYIENPSSSNLDKVLENIHNDLMLEI